MFRYGDFPTEELEISEVFLKDSVTNCAFPSSALPDLVLDTDILRVQMQMTVLPLRYLKCAMEENCLAKSAAVQIR